MKGLAATLGLLLGLVLGCSKTTEAPTASAALPALSDEAQQAAVQRGKIIVADTFSLLRSNLQFAIEQGGISNALPFCSLAALPLTAGMAAKHGVVIRRVTHQARNPADKADAFESAILKHFETALTATNAPPPVVTNFTAGTAAFFAPIVLNNELCLKCHGETGRDILPDHVALIQRLYPQDEATGFKLGDLRGAWRIDFPLATLRRENE